MTTILFTESNILKGTQSETGIKPPRLYEIIEEQPESLWRIFDLERALHVTGDTPGNVISLMMTIGLIAWLSTLLYVTGVVLVNAYVLIASDGIQLVQ